MTDPGGIYGDDAEALAALLRELGAEEPEIAAAVATGRAGPLALDLVLRSAPPTTPAAAAAAAGCSVDDFRQIWQALGFPPIGDDDPIPAGLGSMAPLLMTASEQWLGPAAALGIARVVGNASARIAEAVVDAFRVGFEVPQLTGGAPYSSVVRRYLDMTRDALPALETFLTAALRAHLVHVASGAWTADDDRTTRRDLFVGFVDLVGYTSLSRSLTPAELADLLREFESVVADTVGRGGGRLVKLIGDGAMFVADDPVAGCAIALGLVEGVDRARPLPPARVGADCGSVITLAGDYFGEVVNRAARLVAIAEPSTVAVGAAVADRCATAYGFDPLPPQALKGFTGDAEVHRLRPR